MSLGKFSKNSFGKCAHLAIQIAAVSGEEIKLAYGFDQLMAGGGVALIGMTLVPLLSGLFG